MLAHLLKISKHTFIYSLGATAERGIGFFLVPLYTRYLSPEDYGVLGISITTMAMMLVFASLGTGSAISMAYNENDDRKSQGTAIGTALATTAIGSIVLSIIMAVLATPLSSLLFGTEEYTSCLTLIAILIVTEGLLFTCFIVLRVQQRPVRYVTGMMAKFLLGVGLNIWFIVGMGWGVNGILLSSVITSSLLTIYFIYNVIRSTDIGFSRKKLKSMMAFGTPFMSASVLNSITGLSDRYFILFMMNASSLGIYSLGYQFGGVVVALAVSPFLAAWGPFYWAVSKDPNAFNIYSKVATYYFMVAVPIALVLAVLAKEMIQIVAAPEFAESYLVIGLIALSGVISGTTVLAATGLALVKKTWWVPITAGTGAIINIGLNWLLIPVWGIVGAAAATVVSTLAVTAVMLKASRRHNKIDYEWGRIGKVIVVAIVVFSLSLSVQGEPAYANMMIKAMILLLYPAGLYITGFFQQEELVQIKEWIGKVR